MSMITDGNCLTGIADFRLPIADLASIRVACCNPETSTQSEIGNLLRQSVFLKSPVKRTAA